jgi:hypothetical protein
LIFTARPRKGIQPRDFLPRCFGHRLWVSREEVNTRHTSARVSECKPISWLRPTKRLAQLNRCPPGRLGPISA